MMEQVEALESALANTTRLVAGVREDQWTNPTPCADWDVRELVTHTVGVMANFASGAAGKGAIGDPGEFDLGADPGATCASVAADCVSNWSKRGELESNVDLGGREFPGSVAININMLDAYVHGWDIAQATGQDPGLDSELCAGITEFARQIVPESPRDGNNFAAVVALTGEISAPDELLAYLGRRP